MSDNFLVTAIGLIAATSLITPSLSQALDRVFGVGSTLRRFDAGPRMLYSCWRRAMDSYSDETALLTALRARDEAAFTYLVEQYHAALVRVARIFVRDSTIAEEIAQETWLAVLKGLDSF